jgi:hypothetical protein
VLEKNANVNVQGGRYSNALYAASEEGYEQVVKLLLEKNADVDKQRETHDNAQYRLYGNALNALFPLMSNAAFPKTRHGCS